MRAGVFDSGVGGLSVVRSLLSHKLFDEIIYYGDTARVPYGVKDEDTIIRYSLDALKFFKNFKIDVLICACNSVSSYAIPKLREKAPFPVFGVIEPGVLALKQKLKNTNSPILILGTKATVKSEKYQDLLKGFGYKNVSALAPSLFVPIVEEGLLEGAVLNQVMEHYFSKVKEDPKAIILGCTHFPLIQKQIQAYFPNALLIHSGEAIVEHLNNSLNISPSKKDTNLKLFASESPENLKKMADFWLDLKN
ncbi:MAG: glutamate racemase [Campylobacteraceae bacterium]|nr:glutamate racemase [Campylobacteraceae bacterium]